VNVGAAQPDSWQQPLLQALGDRIQVQLASRSEQAVLHLNPPQLGRVEIAIHQQGGVLQVQMSATHDEVANQLRRISEPLRHDLVQRHAGDVSVQVASLASGSAPSRDGQAFEQGRGSSSHDGRDGREPERQPARARDEADAASAVTTFADRFASVDAHLQG